MSARDDEFSKKLRATFRIEASEHLHAMTAGCLELEKAPAPAAQRKIVETVFRAAHSLKGAARAVDFAEIESLCQSLENVFAAWRRQKSAPSSSALDELHRTLDAITAALSASEAVPGAHAVQPGLAKPARPARSPERSVTASRDERAPAPSAEQAPSAETVRVAVAKLEARLLEAEEMLTVKLTAGQWVRDLRELKHRFEAWKDEGATVEPEVRALRQAMNRPAPGVPPSPGLARLLEFLDRNLDYQKSIEGRVTALTRSAEQNRHVVGRLVDGLLEDSKKLLLLPFATLLAPFPKLVRDLCREQGKEADLTIVGEEIEIDKRILEEMKDPLIHLLRNCVDHGIEPPDERARRGKPPRAAITLAATQANGNKMQFLVSDNGAGLDTRKVKESAVKHGVISAADAARLDDAGAQDLIFQSEVSTSPIITQVSGRGLGLAIVREKAEKLGGKVSVESAAGAGTTFRIVVPAARATFRGILVEAGGELLVVPTMQVKRVARAKPDDVKTVEGRDTLSFDGRTVSLVRLTDALEISPAEPHDPPGGAPVIIAGVGDQCVAFAVDAVVDELEVLVKPLPKPLVRVRNVAAATVLGSGQVAPILNVGDLLKSAPKAAGAPRLPAGGAAAKKAEARTILLVEDSVTSRMLLKGILESAGYRVKTAVDGMEAFTFLRTEPVDAVVSDVEMPRMDGFDLTERIRADQRMAELPVVLVTALETREDRERGVDVGANAYLVKSSFDQSNLLDAVRRLLRTGEAS